MTDPRLLTAIANNAAWCDAVALTHHGETAFAPACWRNAVQSPPFYPNLITLTADAVAAQIDAANALAETGALEEGWGVKDSFAALDLAPLGFELLFTAQWLWREPRAGELAGPDWKRANNEPKLAAWERAFTAGNEPLNLFRPALLTDPAIAFFGTWQRQDVTAGFAANTHAGVTAISNVFAAPNAPRDFVNSVTAAASAFAKGGPLTCYMPEDETPAWRAAGFEVLGPLRVWVRS